MHFPLSQPVRVLHGPHTIVSEIKFTTRIAIYETLFRCQCALAFNRPLSRWNYIISLFIAEKNPIYYCGNIQHQTSKQTNTPVLCSTNHVRCAVMLWKAVYPLKPFSHKFLPARRYAAYMLARVLAMAWCLCLSVRHKSVFYRNGWTELSGFGSEASFGRSYFVS